MSHQKKSRVTAILRVPLIGSFIKEWEERVVLSGPIVAAQQLMEKSHTNAHISYQENSKEILATKPCVIAFNHPYEIETYAVLASLPNRPDAKMVISGNVLALAPKMRPYIVPVWIDHQAKRHHGKLSGKIINYFNLRPDLHPKEAHLKNIGSITKAQKHVVRGGIVLMAPEGFRGKKGPWFSGIGHLISGVGSDNEAYYISCHIGHTSNLDWLRLFPILGHILPTITVTFSAPQPLRDIINTYHDPKNIALGLE